MLTLLIVVMVVVLLAALLIFLYAQKKKRMCGIVGIYLKSEKFESSLGKMLSEMLVNMGSRGPDSAGFAIYKKESNEEYKYSLCLNDISFEKLKNNFDFRGLGKVTF